MSILYAGPMLQHFTDPDPTLLVGTPMEWVGADGSVWLLTDRSRGVVLKRGVRGLLMPRYDRYSSTSPVVPGSRHKGSRATDREVFWPVKVFTGKGSLEWMRLNRAFWKSFDPDIPGTWIVKHPDGGKRRLSCRFIEVEDELDRNPLSLGWETYRIRMLANQPFWTGDPVTQSWKTAESKPYYNTGADTAATLQVTGDTVTIVGHGYLAGQQVRFRSITGTTGIAMETPYYAVNPTANTFQLAATVGGVAIDLTGVDGTGTLYTVADYLHYLSSGTSIGDAVFTNEGDEPAYPTWQGVGPFTELTVGVEGETLTIPFAVESGKAVEINTHPVDGQRLWYGDWDLVNNTVINRVNRTADLSGDQRFAPIPAGESRQLSLTITGTGTVIATITPQFRSAW